MSGIVETVETEIGKLVPYIFPLGAKMFDCKKTREELAATREELAAANRKLAQVTEDRDRIQTTFDAFQAKQQFIIWGGSFAIIILLAIMITSVRHQAIGA
jgi:hypothetical protein